MGEKNSFNPRRGAPGTGVNHEANRLKYTQALANQEQQFGREREKNEGSKFIPDSEPVLEKTEAEDVENTDG